MLDPSLTLRAALYVGHKPMGVSLTFYMTTEKRWSTRNVVRRVRKTAKSDYYLRHVRPSVHMEQLDSHWTDFD
jgi:hypothetical protein